MNAFKSHEFEVFEDAAHEGTSCGWINPDLLIDTIQRTKNEALLCEGSVTTEANVSSESLGTLKVELNGRSM